MITSIELEARFEKDRIKKTSIEEKLVTDAMEKADSFPFNVHIKLSARMIFKLGENGYIIIESSNQHDGYTSTIDKDPHYQSKSTKDFYEK